MAEQKAVLGMHLLIQTVCACFSDYACWPYQWALQKCLNQSTYKVLGQTRLGPSNLVLDGGGLLRVLIDATNATKQSMHGGNVALCQITLTTYFSCSTNAVDCVTESNWSEKTCSAYPCGMLLQKDGIGIAIWSLQFKPQHFGFFAPYRKSTYLFTGIY